MSHDDVTVSSDLWKKLRVDLITSWIFVLVIALINSADQIESL